MAYNTGNPVGSTDPRDFKDNAEILDQVINGTGETINNRLGESVRTLAGLAVMATGVPAIEAAETAIAAQAAAEAARDATYVNADMYTTTAAGLAATTVGDQFQVPAGDNLSIQRYRHDAGPVATAIGPALPSASAVAAVAAQQFTDYKLYPCFRRNGTVALNLTAIHAESATRGQIYRAVKSLKLFGFDRAKPLMLRILWNDTTTGNYFRFQLYEYSGSAWSVSFDSGSSVTMASLGFANNQTVTYRKTSGAKTVEAVIDLTLVPVGSTAILNATSSPDLIIDESCFADAPVTVFADEPTGRAAVANGQYFFVRGTGKNSLLEYQRTNSSASVLKSTSLAAESRFLEHLNIPCFVPFESADMTGLATAYSTVTRGQIYKAFRSLKLTGFDKTRPHKLRAIWNDAYNPSHLFRLIINEYDGSAWTASFDSTSLDMTALGFVNSQTVAYSQTVSGRTVEAVIDLSLIPVNVNAILNATDGTPDMIISAACFVDAPDADLPISEKLAMVNAAKPYFNSRRKPTISFVFDDLNDTDALVFEIMQEYGFLPSFALISTDINPSNVAEYQGYYLAGCSIIAHSTDGLPMSDAGAITYEQVEQRMADSKAAIESHGIKVSGWQTPSSVLHSSFLPLVEKYFGYGFTTLNSGLFDSTVDPVRMARYGLEAGMEDHNVAGVKARIDDAIDGNELLVIYGHKMPSTYLNADTTPMVSESEFREVLQYLRDKVDAGECQVLPTDEAVYQYYKTPVIE